MWKISSVAPPQGTSSRPSYQKTTIETKKEKFLHTESQTYDLLITRSAPYRPQDLKQPIIIGHRQNHQEKIPKSLQFSVELRQHQVKKDRTHDLKVNHLAHSMTSQLHLIATWMFLLLLDCWHFGSILGYSTLAGIPFHGYQDSPDGILSIPRNWSRNSCCSKLFFSTGSPPAGTR